MSKKTSKPKHSRFTESNKKSPRSPQPSDEEEEEEDDYGIPVSPTGSVLMPAPNPYNMLEKIREANEQLLTERTKLDMSPREPKVRFVEPVTVDEDDFMTSSPSVQLPAENLDSESKPSKILLVTVPTAYSIESEEILTDDDCEDDLDFNDDDFRGTRSFQECSIARFSESEEEVDSTLPLTEETLTSSLETVLCRSETEESELTECFTKAINLNTENDLIDRVSFDSNNILDCKESLGENFGLVENIDICEKNDMKNERVVREKLKKHPNISDAGKTQKSSSFKTVKPDLSVSKSPCKLGVNTLKKRNAPLYPRPSTAPVKRACCKMGIVTKLPAYNGLRSEYGLSKEQLLEREKKKYELSKAFKLENEKKWLEERQKQKESENKFKNWLIKKKKEAELKTLRRLQQSNYCFRTTPAPTSHLDKIGLLRRKILKQENTCLLLEEILRNAKPQEQKTYRIYLGLCV